MMINRHTLNYLLDCFITNNMEKSRGCVIKNTGYCHCCRNKTIFKSRNIWLRDHYICLKCHSLPRQRHLQHILDSHFEGWEKLSIHESSPSNKFISKYSSSYTYSHYYSDIKPGQKKRGVRCENLESLTFDDNSIDIFITQDVFEHVFNPDLAAKEIIRVLKPGGIHIFTAPKHNRINISYPRAIIKNNKIEYLFEEQYHGNPIGNRRALVTWDYGNDFESLLYQWSGCHTTTYNTPNNELGIDGEFLEVFVTRKWTRDHQ